MLTAEEMKKLNEILYNVREINGVVKEIKLWRKFVTWAFVLVTIIVTMYDFCKLTGVIK